MPPRDFVAVKAPVFSTAKLRGVDPTLGPAMQSTGEVIGIHADPRVAMAKALVAASLRPPMPRSTAAAAGRAAVDRRSRQGAAGRAGGAADDGGLSVGRNSRHARVALRVLGHEVEQVERLGEATDGGRTVLDAIASGDVLLVVNTPSPESRPVRDAGAIRLAALAEGIVCLTSIDTALAAAAALDPAIADRLADVRPLGSWLEADTVVKSSTSAPAP